MPDRKSEQLSTDQLALFAAAWQTRQAEAEAAASSAGVDDEDDGGQPGTGGAEPRKKGGGRQALPRHLKRERILHDLPDEEKQCHVCQQDLRPIGEDSSERYEFIPAQLTVIEGPHRLRAVEEARFDGIDAGIGKR